MSDPTDADRPAREPGYGRRIGWGERPALLVVDFQRAFTDPTLPLGASLDREIAETVRLLAAARAAHIPIYFSAIRYEEEDARDAGVWLKKIPAAISLHEDRPDAEIDPRLGRRPDEAVLVKKYASAFFGTDFASRLNARRIDTLVLAGCTTSGCVRATAIDAVQNGFRPMVVREAVGDRSRPAHDQSLIDLDAKYADVVSMAETLEVLSKPSRGRRPQGRRPRFTSGRRYRSARRSP